MNGVLTFPAVRRRSGLVLGLTLLFAAGVACSMTLTLPTPTASGPSPAPQPSADASPVAASAMETPAPSEPVNDDPISPALRRLNPDGPKPIDARRLFKALPRDAIRPIYHPTFAPGAEAPLDPEDLVMGVFIDGEARAYPVRTLAFREMVNDEVGGVPVLVTW